MKCDFKPFGKATFKMIESYEQRIGFTLPKAYKTFLLQYNGGTINTSEYRAKACQDEERGYWSFWVEDLNCYLPMQVLRGLGVEHFDLQEVHKEYGGDLPPNAVIIGDDMMAGMIVLIGEAVYYYDHAQEFEDSDEDMNAYKIADDFDSFLDGLTEDIECPEEWKQMIVAADKASVKRFGDTIGADTIWHYSEKDEKMQAIKTLLFRRFTHMGALAVGENVSE